jgi:hypothetical protein
MINSSLYGIFLGGLTFSIWGRQLLTRPRIKQGIQIAAIALSVGAPAIVQYAIAVRQDSPVAVGIPEITYLGASLNSLPIPSVYHPLNVVRQFARSWYAGPYDESGIANLGLVTCLLGLLGLFMTIKHRKHMHLAWPVLTGIVLALGLFLKWDGQLLRSPVFQSVDAFVWRAGHTLKPELFASLSPESGFRRGVPLPGFVLAATIPFFESARTMSRYIFVAILGLAALSAYGLHKLPGIGRYLLAVIWLIEVWPNPTASQAMPLIPHPAYAWLARQDLEQGEGIVDIKGRRVMISGETLFATSLHGKPTASGVGSFWPRHTWLLQDYLSTHGLSDPEAAWVFQQYGIHYVFFHRQIGQADEMWELASQNPAFRPIQCFDPPPAPSPWPWPICVAQVIAPTLPINLLRRAGWSGDEEWGVWSEGPNSEAQWIATRLADSTLTVEAFPFCVPDKRQMISISVNGHPLTRNEWDQCDTWRAELFIPRSLTRVGWNTLSFEYGYAASPAQVTRGENPDARLLATGFTKLEVRK